MRNPTKTPEQLRQTEARLITQIGEWADDEAQNSANPENGAWFAELATDHRRAAADLSAIVAEAA